VKLVFELLGGHKLPPLFELNYKPALPIKADYGIGVVGAGQIVNQAHLPAYKNAGFRVLAITDIDRAAANATAARFDIPRICQSLDELLDMPQIEIVDIAVPAKHNLAVAKKALEANKHVLVQKPMAEITKEAVEMVEAARKQRRKLAVNQQMRWSPSVRAAGDVLRRRLLGEVLHCSIDIDIRTRWDVWPWFSEHPYPELYYHTIHHVDTVRGWLRDPLQLYASLANHPHSGTKGPTRTYMVFKYPGDLRTTFHVNHHTAAPNESWRAEFRIEGTVGWCQGTIGLLLNYPMGRSDVFKLAHQELIPGGSLDIELQGRWFPDAFLGPMSSLMDAITTGAEPETSGEEVLGTLRLLDAIRTSHETGQSVAL
jgi:predicted dehydrogenase